MSFDVQKVRAQFPALTQKIRGKPLVYLDSAASALKPWPVIERISQFYTYETANVHRGAHFLADRATTAFEESREKIKKFINAKSTEEIIFTKGTTESINLTANSFGSFLNAGDEILLSEVEHHANLVPWQALAQQKSLKLKFVEVSSAGELNQQDLIKKLSAKTKLVAVTHCSNTLGSIFDVAEIIKLAHQAGAKVLVDGAQMVANRKVDVQALDADFYCFSGHKLFGPYGVGILYGKKELLEQMPPYQYGGSMIHTVDLEKSTFNDLPYKFEAGTPNIEGVIALAVAIDYINQLGFENIYRHEHQLLIEATEKLQSIPGLKIIGQAKNKVAIISFVVEGLHHADIGQILDQEGIAVRVGHHCTLPLMKKFSIAGTVRASFSVFNNSKDIDLLVAAIIKAKEMLS